MKIEYIRVESCPVLWRSYEDRVQSFKEAWERSYTTEHVLHTIKIRLYMTFIRLYTTIIRVNTTSIRPSHERYLNFLLRYSSQINNKHAASQTLYKTVSHLYTHQTTSPNNSLVQSYAIRIGRIDTL